MNKKNSNIWLYVLFAIIILFLTCGCFYNKNIETFFGFLKEKQDYKPPKDSHPPQVSKPPQVPQQKWKRINMDIDSDQLSDDPNHPNYYSKYFKFATLNYHCLTNDEKINSFKECYKNDKTICYTYPGGDPRNSPLIKEDDEKILAAYGINECAGGINPNYPKKILTEAISEKDRPAFYNLSKKKYVDFYCKNDKSNFDSCLGENKNNFSNICYYSAYDNPDFLKEGNLIKQKNPALNSIFELLRSKPIGIENCVKNL